ncbi:hypothetical protein D0Z08_19600 [Nocardioides immobilis]|uniref:VWA domain-containing protein n=1 Tax=Nocardioides immobilis TaxID=2049295 RepID=A0A417XYJ2_9ACTN|nr:hypothetical protein [Nocardioides immobilis]RHW25434.1 hypothetical protein D0Z08_19600 [Nocardioides immobilis]
MVGSSSSRGKGKKKYAGKGGKKPARGGSGQYTTLYIGVVVGVLVVAAIFAFLFFRPKDGETQGAACAIVVDRTGSSVNEVTRASYIEQATQMVDACRELRASFAVFYFDNQNAKLQEASDEPFELWRPATRRKSVGEEEVAEEKESAIAAVESVFETDPEASTGGHGSDIVTALSLASQSLHQQAAVEGVDETYLVVLTDGYQTGDLSMRRAFPDRDAKVGPLLEHTRDLDLIPQLDGVAVSFGGVGGGVASDRAQIPPWFEALVKQYWTQLIEEAGGGMCVYNVEPAYLPGVC